MPEISIGKDGLGRSEFVFKPKPGEPGGETAKLHFSVHQASSFIKSARREENEFERNKLFAYARARLNFLPKDSVEVLIDALYKNETGTTLTFSFKGETLAEGFTVETLVSPKKT